MTKKTPGFRYCAQCKEAKPLSEFLDLQRPG
jgi:hypothetical protein